MAPLRLVPRALVLALARRIGFDDHCPAGVSRLELRELDPHRLGEAGRVDQPVAVPDFEEHGGAIILELEDRRAFARRPRLEVARDGIGPHSDLVERRLDLVERQPPVR